MNKVFFLAVAFGLFSASFADLTVVRTIPIGGSGGLKGPAWSIGNGFISEGPNGVEYLDQSEWFAVKGSTRMAFLEQAHCDTETYLVAAAGDSGVSFTNNRLDYHEAFNIPGGAKDVFPLNGSAIAAGDSGIYWINYGCMGKNPKITQRIGLPLTERITLRNINKSSVDALFALHNAGRNITIYTKLWSDSIFRKYQTLYTGTDTCGIDVSPQGDVIYHAGGELFSIISLDSIIFDTPGGAYSVKSRTWLPPGHLNDIVVDHNRKYAYVLMTNWLKCGAPRCWIQRVLVFNVKDAGHPVLEDSLNLDLPDFNEYNAAGNARRLWFQDSLLYIANLDHGVVIARGYGVMTATEDRQVREMDNTLQMSPNPFNPAVSVSFQMEKAGIAQIQVFSINGKRILNSQEKLSAGHCNIQLNLKGFPSGMYLVRVIQSDRILEKAAFLCR